MAQRQKVNLADIRLLALDVDGVLTNGQIIIHGNGSESKSFDAIDGHRIRMWRRTGGKVALLSGRASGPTRHYADELQIEYVFENCHKKLPILKKLLERIELPAANVAYVGDDLSDLPVMRYVGFAVAVVNAADEVKHHADYVTTSTGGCGAVREVIEHILKNTGRWNELMERYLA
jgi:3-deoxy-D-manno-octulosonate 8-phosphate phosphatase (KDO 8-P phosphatase)